MLSFLSFIGCANRKPIADIPAVDLAVPAVVPALDTKPFLNVSLDLTETILYRSLYRWIIERNAPEAKPALLEIGRKSKPTTPYPVLRLIKMSCIRCLEPAKASFRR